jgi:hypothetical protein
MGSESPGELLVYPTFDYTSLDADIAQQVQSAAHRIRHMVRQTLEVLIAIGIDLLAVKQALPHGSFGPWLRAEFGWAERTARNFMIVAERFGTKMAIIADLRIDPTAAYLLAAPSAPEAASEVAIQRAERGERITASVAKEILSSLREKPPHHQERSSGVLPANKLLGQLLESLESFRQRWNPREVSVLALQLREFADSLVDEPRGRRLPREM